MSKQPNKLFEHNIFHDEQAIYPLQSGRKQGKLLKSLVNKYFFLNLKLDTEQKAKCRWRYVISNLRSWTWREFYPILVSFAHDGWIFAKFWWQNARLPRTSRRTDSQQKYSLGGDMSFLICGPGPGGSVTQFWWVLPMMVGFLPNFGDKMPDFRGQAGDLIVSKNILSLFCKSIPGRV